MRKNKVKYNLRNVHYAPITVSEEGNVTFATPIPIPGAVSVSLSKIGDMSPFYGDGIVFFMASPNSGYDGDLEIALVPESFKNDCLGMHTDANGLLYESADDTAKPFALLFEFEGDIKAIRHCLYFCYATQPETASETKTENIEPVTDKLTIKATPSPYLTNENGAPLVKIQTGDNTSAEKYANWYKEVPVPAAAIG